MFDDKPTNQNPAGQSEPAKTMPSVPANLPGAKPSISSEPEDILQDLDPANQDNAIRPSESVDFETTPPPAVPPRQKAQPTEPFARRFRKIIILIVIIILIGGALAFGGWYAYNTFFAQPDGTTTNNQSNINTSNQNINVNQPVLNQNANAAQNQPAVVNQQPTQPLDRDRDGLTDDQEATYGTDPLVSDTDGDGLSDRDEVMIYHTDPNNPDTDGDGFTDGQEVSNGYNPNGPGKLLEVPQL